MTDDTQNELDRITDELLEGEELPEADDDILNNALLNSLLEEAEANIEDTLSEEEAEAEALPVSEEKDPVVTVLTVLALLLMAGILGVLIWWIVVIRSIF